MTVRKAVQFSVCVEDKPGKLAEVTKALCEAGINLTALAGWTEGEGKAVIACIPEDPDKVRALGVPDVQEKEVIVVEGDDKLGVGYAISQKLAAADINLKVVLMQAAGGKYQAVLSTCGGCLDKAVSALEGCGCCCGS
ncbi:MAG: hypothetical protein COZ06_05500 [Armatimonadetes bacterium CG_4_10_14_3_um_filter_66_18]|nr:hypothetical protein [Armatimonadota bacterium]OIP04033.1 MAG: hypothetical protein AUJ96_13730 [Armatimonadetes bacterium CG2_30_66_41]PIU87635.1 MAG: hypothetical protein COS65_33695 [Armatimonadetes bacterium CG06_land_8_20_14_3_00_66_21]PIX37132.1 MAG: hypothetical protein COZ57_35935 [Armatimonadetes bacterium CG_4_8_14_3_um_filter_66_20]PIY51188.1 MAG: hypothetical protein COZ06_05500 [Armatimonadetes bacterium CG_4_10_14_3_um_filter_66_18]PIZ40487.1 MAG: hypothetical protein COY42_21